MLGSDELRWACSFAKNLLENSKIKDKTDKRKKRKFIVSRSQRLNEQQIARLVEFSSMLVDSGVPEVLNFTTQEKV